MSKPIFVQLEALTNRRRYLLSIQQFIYHNKPREVIITQETPESIFGYDLSYITDDDVKRSLREAAKTVSLEGKEGDEAKKELEKLSRAKTAFRHFKRANVEDRRDEQTGE
jgi:hypothetical protein